MFEFKLPDVGEGLHEAEVVEWLVQPGATVSLDQPMVDIQTDKAIVQIPAPVAGVVRDIRVPVGQVAKVGDVLVVFEVANTPAVARVAAPTLPATSNHAPVPVASPIPHQRVLAAPAVRKLARQLGIDLALVRGSGPVGRVLPEDVRAFVARPSARPETLPITAPTPMIERVPVNGHAHSAEAIAPPPPPTIVAPGPEAEQVPLTGLRRRIAERMEQAARIPQVTVFEEVDATALLALKQNLTTAAERQHVRLTVTALLIKLVVQALRENPVFNAALDLANQQITYYHVYHIGVAAATPDGLVVPVVRHVEQRNLLQVSQELARLTEGARQRTLTREELSGSTFTLTNFGSFGGLQGTPILNPPEAAILGCGRIEKRAVVVDEQIAIRPVMSLALTFDHRLIDGANAVGFLGRVRELFANPMVLMLDLV
jgi:pyruvate dehydrogenase E2 component (dihydrolipoamide acetyltransferase)